MIIYCVKLFALLRVLDVQDWWSRFSASCTRRAAST
jgi:hypothetical protein